MTTGTTSASESAPGVGWLDGSRLRRWYAARGRHDLPWRLTRDPYAVLVSEVMLQQTQVGRVLPAYRAWMRRWPTAHALAAAGRDEVIRAWTGLGYNRRAVNLHRAVIHLTESGRTGPRDETELAGLPGIGPYTAAAVACFAHGRRTVVLDTNVRRVVARAALGAAAPSAVPPAALRAAAAAVLPARGARDHNLALMDLGALVCRARVPRCGECPLATRCRWLGAGRPLPDAAPRPSAIPFPLTSRFARGRLVEALRVRGSLPADDLRDVLPAAHHDRLFVYLEGLVADGLVEAAGEAWRLPGG